VADGTILAEYAAPAYVAWAREQIESAKLEAGKDRHHRLTVFAFACASPSAETARQQLRPLLAPAIASGKINAQITPMGIMPQVQEILKSGGIEHLENTMPDDWIDQLAIAGTPEDWALAIDRLLEAGANTVVLLPLPDKGLEELDMFARHFLR
jgi:alkanesulfonate monooxygenase SsuD/methylene tetrahydromethanopterin reductase-like flavin-dependent oxidoreductase (luciferase family)